MVFVYFCLLHAKDVLHHFGKALVPIVYKATLWVYCCFRSEMHSVMCVVKLYLVLVRLHMYQFCCNFHCASHVTSVSSYVIT